jgi:hypothetical protein
MFSATPSPSAPWIQKFWHILGALQLLWCGVRFTVLPPATLQNIALCALPLFVSVVASFRFPESVVILAGAAPRAGDELNRFR